MSKPELMIRDPHNTPVTFVNHLVAQGALNGNVNLTFATANFTPAEDGKSVEPDFVITSRLRMDLYCAMHLHAALGKIIADNTKPASSEARPN